MRFWYVFCLSRYLYTNGHDIRKQHTKFYQNRSKIKRMANKRAGFYLCVSFIMPRTLFSMYMMITEKMYVIFWVSKQQICKKIHFPLIFFFMSFPEHVFCVIMV